MLLRVLRIFVLVDEQVYNIHDNIQCYHSKLIKWSVRECLIVLKYNLDRILVYLFTHTLNINFSVRHIFSRFIKVGVFCHTYWLDKTYKLRKKWRRWRVFKNLLNANYYFFQLIFPVIFLFNVAFTQKFKKAFLKSFPFFANWKGFELKDFILI